MQSYDRADMVLFVEKIILIYSNIYCQGKHVSQRFLKYIFMVPGTQLITDKDKSKYNKFFYKRDY